MESDLHRCRDGDWFFSRDCRAESPLRHCLDCLLVEPQSCSSNYSDVRCTAVGSYFNRKYDDALKSCFSSFFGVLGLRFKDRFGTSGEPEIWPRARRKATSVFSRSNSRAAGAIANSQNSIPSAQSCVDAAERIADLWQIQVLGGHFKHGNWQRQSRILLLLDGRGNEDFPDGRLRCSTLASR